MTTSSPPLIRYEPRGAARDLFLSHDPEVVLDGPAGTGKTRGELEKLNACAIKYPGMRALIFRKRGTDLSASGLVTFEQKVRPDIHGVRFFGGNAHTPAHYRYPNGSVIVVGGLDKPTKVLSTEYDLALGLEIIELEEAEWELVGSRLRNGRMPYQQLIGDTNPGAPSHWILQRVNRGVLRRLPSRYEDNPLYWDAIAGDWTQAGRDYVLGRLGSLTGVRLERYRFGRWVAAEGVVYEGWDPKLHLVEPFHIPWDWPRYWVIDYGYTNPFCWQAWAEDPDGRLYCYREIYMSRRLVEDHAHQVFDLTRGEPAPSAVICDHDAEDRATFERHSGHDAARCQGGAAGYSTTAAIKDVSPGIQHVATRLRRAGDGRPRLYFFVDRLVERDPDRDQKKLPCSTTEEFESYVWDTSSGRTKGEQPKKANDHGMDAARYMVAHRDLGPTPLEAW